MFDLKSYTWTSIFFLLFISLDTLTRNYIQLLNQSSFVD